MWWFGSERFGKYDEDINLNPFTINVPNNVKIENSKLTKEITIKI